MSEFLQRASKLYISKTVESPYNASITGGTNYIRALNDTPLVTIPNQEFRTDQGRAGSEFASAVCNTYWEPPGISLAADADFELMGRLWLRAVGGSITNTTTVALLAGKHSAPMLPESSGLQLPSFNAVSVMDGSGATYKFTGMCVGQATLSQEGVNAVKASFQLVGSGKYYSPHGVSSLPSLASFSCLRPYAYLSYDNGDPVDLGAGCTIRSWTVTLDNALAAQDDRCTGDLTQDAGDPSSTGGASDAAYNSKLTHRDRTVTAQLTILADTLSELDDMWEKVTLTDFTFGVRGVDLDPGGTPDTTYEFLKLIIPSAKFTRAVNVDSNGKFAVTLDILPITSGTSVLTVEVQNSTIGTFA